MRKLLAVIGLAVLTHASAQGVMVSFVSPSDLVMLFDDLQAMEITVPAGTQSYSVSHGAVPRWTSFSGGMHGTPTRLRIVTGFPDGLAQAECAENSLRTATLLYQFHAYEGPDALSGTPHHRQHTCLPRPERLAGEHWLVLEHPQAPQLDEWTPVFVYATSEDSTDSDGNYLSRLTPPETWYSVQVLFRSDTYTGAAGSPQPLEEALRTHPAARAARQLLEEYDAQDAGQAD